MTKNEALLALFKAPKHTLKYQGSGFGNALCARLAANGIITLRHEETPKMTMKLTTWGIILAEELK